MCFLAGDEIDEGGGGDVWTRAGQSANDAVIFPQRFSPVVKLGGCGDGSDGHFFGEVLIEECEEFRRGDISKRLGLAFGGGEEGVLLDGLV